MGVCVACQPLSQAIVFQQVSFPIFALHVIMISLALLGAYLGHAYQETTDCPAPGSDTLLVYVTAETCLVVVTNLWGLVGILFLGAKVRSWQSSRSKHSKLTPLEASVATGTMINILPCEVQDIDPQVNQDATSLGQLTIPGRSAYQMPNVVRVSYMSGELAFELNLADIPDLMTIGNIVERVCFEQSLSPGHVRVLFHKQSR